MDIKSALDREYVKFQEGTSNTSERVDGIVEGFREMVGSHLQHSQAMLDSMYQLHAKHDTNHKQMLDTLTRPKTIVRGPDGKIVGVK